MAGLTEKRRRMNVPVPQKHMSRTQDAVWRTRPASLAEPQERVQRHTVEQIVEIAPMVQILDVPVPSVVPGGVQHLILQRIVEQAYTEDTEQVIEAPEISCPGQTPPRAVLPAPTGLLVEVRHTSHPVGPTMKQ